MKRTPESVCIEYATVVALMREQTVKIKPWDCERAAESEFRDGWNGPTTTIDPCISTLLKKPEGTQHQEHRDWQEEFEEEMCDRCKLSLEAIRERRKLKLRLGSVKRSITAMGKKLALTGRVDTTQPPSLHPTL